jgi:hypothetical protein
VQNWARPTTPTGTDSTFLHLPLLGLEREEHFVFTTGGRPGGNGPLDVDVCLYTLIRWAGLAAKGNPSALHFLFAPLEFTTNTWDQFSARPELFLAKGHVKPFLGFADDQMKRLEVSGVPLQTDTPIWASQSAAIPHAHPANGKNV